ncbi:zinc-binding dehydrogenase [Arcobacter roscoffensis]|uniref:Zinc-binding dehydrogenase n=1 Tax=Arcobacter roscoffensis TaxID=2961520 RepID=A0ABY5E5D3_9BACT|nr:zinc-binding dehydrogenase [Arcobacter roscoffensis]UTJ06385.1 zinc-binding dehydrogenase [Arcobacter roscoffensis]
MKAAVLNNTNQPLAIENITFNELQEGQVLVEIAYSGICHSQLMEVRGKRGEDKWLPHLLGHEATGFVRKVGNGVTKVKEGDKVVLGWIKGEGLNAPCASYDNNGKTINSGQVTTFNEFSIVSENRVTKLEEGIPLDVAVLFGCAIPTGSGIVINEIQAKENTTIAIFGLGGIGLSALMATKLYNFNKVIAIDIEENKLQLAKEFGATHTINSSKEDVNERLKELTLNEGVDYSVEATGLAKIIEIAFKNVKNNGGLCVFASHPQNGDLIKIDPFDLICGKQIKGSWGGACIPDRDLPKFYKLYKEGKLPLEKLLEKRYTLDEINEALDDLENRKVTRPLIQINPALEK